MYNIYIYIYIYAYIHILDVVGGESNREIVSFRSCLRASGRGEAKLLGRARGDSME